MSPDQARWLVEQMTDEQRQRLAQSIRDLAKILRQVEPIVTKWQEAGIDAAEQHANGGTV